MAIGRNDDWTKWVVDEMLMDKMELDEMNVDQMAIRRNGIGRNGNLPMILHRYSFTIVFRKSKNYLTR